VTSGYWVLLALPATALAGVACERIASDYARRIDAGAAVDGATLCAALRAASTTVFLVCAAASLACVVVLILMRALGPLALARAGACMVLLLLALIDARCRVLPDALTQPLMWAGLLLSAAGLGPAPAAALAGAAAGYLFLRGVNAVFVFWRGHEGMGRGDMKLLAALGAWLGWAPLPEVLLAASLGGALVAVLRWGRQAWRATLPFGPFLAAAGGFGLVRGAVVQFPF